MFTASHNPAQYNGIKLCRGGARPVGLDSGLAEIRDLAEHGVPDGRRPGTGTVTAQDLLPAYAEYLRDLVDLSGNRRLRVVVDAGNGMGGHTVPTVLAGLPVDLVPMYFELDGTFPNHEANPLDPANLVDLQARVVGRAAPTSASPSTATPTAASSSTSGASRCRRPRSRRWSPSASWPSTPARR